eukprot:jgi/Ulvmu1/9422/UM051_0050.1
MSCTQNMGRVSARAPAPIMCRRHVPSRSVRQHCAPGKQAMFDVFTQHVNDSTADLLEHQSNQEKVFSWKFLQWLVHEERQCLDPELQEQMADFAGRLVSLRRGVIPPNAKSDSLIADTSEAAEPTKPDTLGRWPVQAKWKPEYEVAVHERAAALKAAIKARKANAVAEITGQVDLAAVPKEEMEARMREVTAARRIAEFLATVADRGERRALLHEALTPPSPPPAPSEPSAPQAQGQASEAGAESSTDGMAAGGATASAPGNSVDAGHVDAGEPVPDEELLHTTPLQLLQAVKALCAEVNVKPRPGEESPLLPVAEGSCSQAEMRRRLADLKADALQAWSDSF